MMLQDLLIEAAEDQFAIYQILTQRGWYTAKQAQQSEIDQARQQVMQMKTSIQS
jgi:spore coat protein CotF